MPLIDAVARRQAAQALARAVAEEGEDMLRVTALGRTAFLAARARAAEAAAPEPLYDARYEGLFDSQVFAAVLLRARLPLMARAAKEGISEGADEDGMPAWLGVGSSTAYIDDHLRDAFLAGTRQVVLLGSGLDCRALRLERPADALFVEVDEQPVLDFKVHRLAAAGHSSYPAALVGGSYLDIDLPAELRRAGVDPGRPVFFLWEANTMYLPSAVARGFLGRLLGDFPGCTVLFDYFTAPVAGPDGPGRTGCPETDRELEVFVRAVGDGAWLLVGPWDAAAAQEELGYEVVEDLSLAEVVRRARGELLGAQLVARYQREFKAGLHACQRFCLVRPGRASAGARGS